MSNSSFNSIIVTGAAGFIGSQFIENLLRSATSLGLQKAGPPEKIIVLDKLTYAGSLATLDHAVELAGGDQARGNLEFVKGDIADRSLVHELVSRVKPKAIVNFAAESHVDRSIESAAEFIETNIMGVFSLLDAARRYHESLGASPQASAFRFIQVSTDEVFGQLGEEGAFTEETPYSPSSPYSASKASGDHLARAWYHTYKLPVIVTNCSNNYGPRQYPEKLIPHMIHCALGNKPLPVYGNGRNVRDWIHVDDHARGVELAMRQGKVGESYCFGGRSERRNLDVVKAICTILDELRPKTTGTYSDQITFVEDRKGHDWRYAIDDTKSETKLGFKRRYGSFEVGLRATVQWYLDNQEWVKAVTKEKK